MGENPQPGPDFLVLPRKLFEDRFSHTIRYARASHRESPRYSPWSEVLNYLSLSASTGGHEAGIREGIQVSFLSCPQWELVYRILKPSGGHGRLSAESRGVITAWRDNPELPEAPLSVETPIQTDAGTSQTSIQADPGASEHLERGKRKRGKESPEGSSPLKKDVSTSDFQEIIKQPDYLVLSSAKGAPLSCHSVWEVKTSHSYDLGGPAQDIRERVAEKTRTQVAAQALYILQEYPLQPDVHCFIIVETHYVYLRYRRCDLPFRLDASVDPAKLIKLAEAIKPNYLSPLKLALVEYTNERGEPCAWFTATFWKDWQSCTRAFAEYANLV